MEISKAEEKEKPEMPAVSPADGVGGSTCVEPRDGMLYALCRGKVIYEKNTPERREKLSEDPELIELHIFNDREEFRYFKLRDRELKMRIRDEEWKIWQKDAPARTLRREEAYDDIYPEVVCTEQGGNAASEGTGAQEKITVFNYIKYDEKDMIHIINYRYSTAVDEGGIREARA